MTDSKIKLVHGRELNSELNQAIPAVILNEEAFNILYSRVIKHKKESRIK